MKQPIKGQGKVKKKRKSASPYVRRKNPFQSYRNKDNQKYGTSKLEMDFARDFLDKYGLVYIYQFEAKEIGRFYDFAVTSYSEWKFIMEEKDGIKCVKQEGQTFPVAFLIEVDGGYYHSDPRVVDKDNLSPMQKHNKFIDAVKDKWAALHCIPLVRVWEYDIRNNPEVVVKELNKYIDMGLKKRRIDENRKRPH